VTLESIRGWVLRFNHWGPEGLIDIQVPGPKLKLAEEQRQAVKEIVERCPIPAVDEVVRLQLLDLVPWLSDEFSVSLYETIVGRHLKTMGYVASRQRALLRELT